MMNEGAAIALARFLGFGMTHPRFHESWMESDRGNESEPGHYGGCIQNSIDRVYLVIALSCQLSREESPFAAFTVLLLNIFEIFLVGFGRKDAPHRLAGQIRSAPKEASRRNPSMVTCILHVLFTTANNGYTCYLWQSSFVLLWVLASLIRRKCTCK